MGKEKKTHVGTSVFTHEDDAGADIHTSRLQHAEHHFFGEPMTPKPQLAEIVLGPPPFGSPDPRTLGHQMTPLEDGSSPVSAAPLDADWVAQHRANLAGHADVENMTKDELRAHADSLGVEYASSDTKDDLKKAISEHDPSATTNDDDEDDDTEDNDDDDDEDTESLSGKTKAELLELAKERGVEVDDSNSKDEVRQALEKDSKK